MRNKLKQTAVFSELTASEVIRPSLLCVCECKSLCNFDKSFAKERRLFLFF